MDHQPQFEFTCRVYLKDGTEFVQTGLGPSKKEAKHKSAANVLAAINDFENKNKGAVTSGYFDNYDITNSTFGNIPTNCVMQLDELLKKSRLPQSKIDTKDLETGQIYAICRVEHIVEECLAPSKKVAKRKVAEKMLKRIENIGEENLKKEINKTDKIANQSLNHDPIRSRKILETENMADHTCTRPGHCKLGGRLNEDFEEINISSEPSSGTKRRQQKYQPPQTQNQNQQVQPQTSVLKL